MAGQAVDERLAGTGLADALAAALPAAVLVEDEDRRVVLVNERLCALFRLRRTPAELAGSDAAALMRRMRMATADPRRFASRAAEVASAGEPAVDAAIEFADGTCCDRDYAPLRMDGGRRGHMWTYRDAAPPRTAAPARSGMDYIALVSHEIRTPLTAIISFTGLLRESQPPLPAEAAGFAEIIERNAHRLLRLVSDLMIVAHVETGVLHVEPAPVAVPEVVADAVRARREVAAGRGVTLQFAAAAAGPMALADRQWLLLTIDKLLSNAVKFSNPPARVTVTARFDDGEWRIDVTDSGIGIPRGERDRVFDPFFRATNARIAQIPGAGLGLSVARAITELQHGRIGISGARGAGTTASIWLRPPP